MTESKAYEQVKLYSDGFIKFDKMLRNPIDYYKKEMKYYISRIFGIEDGGQLESIIEEATTEMMFALKINDENKALHGYAYTACYFAWIEASCFCKPSEYSYHTEFNENQACSIQYGKLDKYNNIEAYSLDAKTFFNKMRINYLYRPLIEEPAMRKLLNSSYYGSHPVIDIDHFNKTIHNAIEDYYKKTNMRNSSIPNEKFHKEIEDNGFKKFYSALEATASKLDFSKKNVLGY